jgi:hypothetical protein
MSSQFSRPLPELDQLKKASSPKDMSPSVTLTSSKWLMSKYENLGVSPQNRVTLKGHTVCAVPHNLG